MLTAQIRECTDCGSVHEVLRELSCTLTHYGRNHWLNASYAACAPYPVATVRALLHYQRILTYKLFNPEWACGIELAALLSRVKTLIVQQQCCQWAEACPFPTADTFTEVSGEPDPNES